MTAVKICGVCRAEDAALAAAAGADYVGVILAAGRSRSRTDAEAARILASAGNARRVGVFVDATVDAMVRSAADLGLEVLQLHGAEPVAAVVALRDRTPARIWKAVRVRSVADMLEAAADYAGVVDGLLLDGWVEGVAGGAGVGFDWDAVAAVRGTLPAGPLLVVAGGLAPDNVAGVAGLLRPDVVDVSSGVEEAIGRKSADRVREFVIAVRNAGKGEGGRGD